MQPQRHPTRYRQRAERPIPVHRTQAIAPFRRQSDRPMGRKTVPDAEIGLEIEQTGGQTGRLPFRLDFGRPQSGVFGTGLHHPKVIAAAQVQARSGRRAPLPAPELPAIADDERNTDIVDRLALEVDRGQVVAVRDRTRHPAAARRCEYCCAAARFPKTSAGRTPGPPSGHTEKSRRRFPRHWAGGYSRPFAPRGN